MITIIDSGISNLGSVAAAFRRIEAQHAITRDPDAVATARAILLPGVGAFGDGMAGLREHGLVEPIKSAAARGVPILGICLGMQLLASSSEEFGTHAGLGLVPGRVVRLTPRHARERVPNIGWCDVSPRPGAKLFLQPEASSYYFAHSYHLQCDDQQDVAAEMSYGGDRITVAVQRGAVFGAQFHPEKSQDAGLSVLAAFVQLCRERAAARQPASP